ncbi:hypothetical protein L249_5481 [Ophiocordyceps polyrhachis-furcata BCC 54312]|uniref:Uncharacterized protein n=1 Tax=Ophiocordyceps polyrhachis-furcata BCC 54312 TaxID=1330021 RepID=A0A367LGJ4_9HYPO|nr:hypothetical protein L249_5481 [Ophiocordyceps polyrhachis-furcata BCC 54312]
MARCSTLVCVDCSRKPFPESPKLENGSQKNDDAMTAKKINEEIRMKKKALPIIMRKRRWPTQMTEMKTRKHKGASLGRWERRMTDKECWKGTIKKKGHGNVGLA